MNGRIEVIGLGAGDLEQLSLGVYRKLINFQGEIYARTKDHPVINELKNDGIDFNSFDDLYEQFEQFEMVYEEIVQTLLKKAEKTSIIYAVPGHPMLAEKTVQLLLQQTDITIEI